jgi:hypothetical protein
VLLASLLDAVPEWHLDGEPTIASEDVRRTPVPVRFERLPLAVAR